MASPVRNGLFDCPSVRGDMPLERTDALLCADGPVTTPVDLTLNSTPPLPLVVLVFRARRWPVGRFSGVDTYLHDVDTAHPRVAGLVGNGALYALVPGKGFLAHREAGDVVHTYVVLHRPVEWFDAIDFTDAPAATARVAAEFDGWAPELLALFTDCASAPVLRSIYELPDDHRWDRVPGVTLLGDAAHATVPGGDGANLAMLDGAELGTAIAAHSDDIEQALADYESRMFPRSQKAAAAAHRTIDFIFGANAPAGVISLFSEDVSTSA